MNRPARYSLVNKGLFAATVVALLAAVEGPASESQPLGQAQQDPVERIRMYDAQPVGIVQTGPARRTLDFTQVRSEQRWVF